MLNVAPGMRAILPMGLGDEGAGTTLGAATVEAAGTTVDAAGTVDGLAGFEAAHATSPAAVHAGRARRMSGLTVTSDRLERSHRARVLPAG